MPEYLYVYADESCLGVQFTDRASRGGAGSMVEVWKDGAWRRRDFWLSEPDTTNNQMALQGAAALLALLKKPARVVYTSDSEYLIKGRRSWVPKWASQGWRRKTGAIENLELWHDLIRAEQRHDVDWRWVRGHTGHVQNEYANHLATHAAKNQTDSKGFVDSHFIEWLNMQRERFDKYSDFLEIAPPEPGNFQPVPKVFL
jgi:ribonuclease HI